MGLELTKKADFFRSLGARHVRSFLFDRSLRQAAFEASTSFTLVTYASQFLLRKNFVNRKGTERRVKLCTILIKSQRYLNLFSETIHNGGNPYKK
jgi:hypothetical protein